MLNYYLIISNVAYACYANKLYTCPNYYKKNKTFWRWHKKDMENNEKSYWKKERYVWLFSPKKLIFDEVEITDTKTIAETFSNFFVTIGPNLALKLPERDANFEVCISKANTKLHEYPLREDEFLEAFESLKINKAPGFDEIHVNVINQIFNHIKKSLIWIFDDSIKLGAFPQKLKLAKVTPVF